MDVAKSAPNIEERYSDEIDLIDILRFVYQEKKKLIVFGLIGAVVGFVLMGLLPSNPELMTTVKVDLEKSLNEVPFDSLKSALGSAAADTVAVQAGIEKALADHPEFKKVFDEKKVSAADLAESMSSAKPGSRIIEIEAGSNPNSYELKVKLPKEISQLDNSKVGISILNGIVQAYNDDNRKQQAAQDRIRATMAPTAYTLALDNFTTISGQLSNLEVSLTELVPEKIVNHVQSAGFAPGSNALEAQFARVRFLMGVAERKGKLKAEDRKKIQEKFLELQDGLGAAQLELEVAAEAKKELLKKNLPLIQKDPLPLFKGIQTGEKPLVKIQSSMKKQILACIAGGFIGLFFCFFVIILTRFFRENWKRITSVAKS